MSVELELMQMQNHAKRDSELLKKILKTKSDKDPYLAFCKVANEYGYNISLFELADMGQALNDAMLRSVNGGGTETFPEWYDFYEMFFDALK